MRRPNGRPAGFPPAVTPPGPANPAPAAEAPAATGEVEAEAATLGASAEAETATADDGAAAAHDEALDLAMAAAAAPYVVAAGRTLVTDDGEIPAGAAVPALPDGEADRLLALGHIVAVATLAPPAPVIGLSITREGPQVRG